MTPNPAHFVSPDPGTAKNSGNQNQQDPFAALIPLHELGLTPGVAVDYRLTGTATANYSCVRTDGTLNAAPGSNQDVTSPLTVSQRFIPDASGEVQGVIVVPPPRPSNTSCPAGTALQAWGSHYTGLVVTDITNGVNWSAGDIGAQA